VKNNFAVTLKANYRHVGRWFPSLQPQNWDDPDFPTFWLCLNHQSLAAGDSQTAWVVHAAHVEPEVGRRAPLLESGAEGLLQQDISGFEEFFEFL